jgi:uncharacterized repeat protein (TIGR03803 family)
MFAGALVLPGGASAYTLTTLHSFCSQDNEFCTGGFDPASGLLRDQSGNLYGTTELGGKDGGGIVFELVPGGNKYTEYILKAFCEGEACPLGAYPEGDLIMDVDGNLYGTTYGGGKYDAGAVFKLSHHEGHVTYTVIHSFCAKSHCTDASLPETGLAYAGQASGALWDESSPLFGTTSLGGANNEGAAYELAPNGGAWAFQVLHSFNPGTRSAGPGPLLVDSSGNLLGVTASGAAYGGGALYRLAAGTWKETTLHNFCAEANCADGSAGAGRLLMDAAGNLFGTTEAGGSGANCATQGGCGVVFERPPGGPYAVIYNFCSLAGCADGSVPADGVIMDAGGSFYGTTTAGGGAGNGGTVFKLTHGGNWTETVLYEFCSQNNCADGTEPITPVTLDAQGNLYGATHEGGTNQSDSGGTVFKLMP